MSGQSASGDAGYNFSAGPAMLPASVLAQAQAELPDWQHGLSALEHSHRGAVFTALMQETDALLRELLAIPDAYEVLYLQGGATSQFAMVPMNLLPAFDAPADYLLTGHWGKKACEQARDYATVNVAASDENAGFHAIPKRESWRCNPKSAYFHYTANETINGVEFHSVPEVEMPLVSDMSSSLFSRPVDIQRFALIYACLQKNIGPAGLTLVIIDKQYVKDCLPRTPQMFNYRKLADAKSLLNTPPTFIWYLTHLVLKWLQAEGGVAAIEKHNQKKAALLYQAIDDSEFYHNPVELGCRSRMNVPFRLQNNALEATFIELAEAAGLFYLQGHRSTQGIRASLYNAMPLAGVNALIDFMRDFEQRYG